MPLDRRKIETGGIYYIQKRQGTAHAQPAVVLSDVVSTKTSGFVAIVYLTDQSNGENPTHVPVTSSGRLSIALCDRLTTVDVSKIGTRLGTVSSVELKSIHKGIAYHLKMDNSERVNHTEEEMAQLQALISLLGADA